MVWKHTFDVIVAIVHSSPKVIKILGFE